jgi:hypothetical protein
MADGMAGNSHSYGADLDTVRAKVAADELEFVEVMLDPAADWGPVDANFLQTWKASYPNDDIILIGDTTPGENAQEPFWLLLADHHQGGVPFGAFIDAAYTWQSFGTTAAISAAAQQ